MKRELNSAEYSVFGAVAGAFTGLVTTPLDVLKTRMMLDVSFTPWGACALTKHEISHGSVT